MGVVLEQGTNGEGLSLRGDVLLKCFRQDPIQRDGKKGRRRLAVADSQQSPCDDRRQLLFQCQFNTCSMSEGERRRLGFHKEELDLIFADGSVDNRAIFELVFSDAESRGASANHAADPKSSYHQRRKSMSPGVLGSGVVSEWLRVNSYENFYRMEGGLVQALVFVKSTHLSSHAYFYPEHSPHIFGHLCVTNFWTKNTLQSPFRPHVLHLGILRGFC